MDKKDAVDMMFNDIKRDNYSEGDTGGGYSEEDYFLTGQGWNLYKIGDRKYRLAVFDMNNTDEFDIDNEDDINYLEENFGN